jgi:hypothetical protein
MLLDVLLKLERKMKQPGCIVCGDPLRLLSETETYLWGCDRKCMEPLNTLVGNSEDVRCFEDEGIRASGDLNLEFLSVPLEPRFVPGAQVYMPSILHHFIGCGWGPCYMSLYKNVIVPYLEAPQVLDYVLRSDVVKDPDAAVTNGISEPKMCGDLYAHLKRVRSPDVQVYLRSHFGTRFG